MKLTLDEMTRLVDDQEKDTFMYKDVDHPDGGDRYRIFNYRLASFQDFQKDPRLLWCRGLMFNLTTGEIACRPMEKFFNYHEWSNNSTDLPESEYWNAFTKHDGSLVSTYIHNDKVYLKSKYSLDSEQAIKATEIFKDNFIDIGITHKEIINILTKEFGGLITINYEYVAPDNIIVVPYSKSEILPINSIFCETGQYQPNEETIVSTKINNVILEDWIEDVYDDKETLHEGYVIESEDKSVRFKVKTNRYSAAHKLKDNINSLKKLVDVVSSGQIDDILDAKDLSGDVEFFNILTTRAENIKNKINLVISTCENFYENNKHLDRADYAILGQKEIKQYFSIVMPMYLGQDIDYNKFFLKNLQLFDDVVLK